MRCRRNTWWQGGMQTGVDRAVVTIVIVLGAEHYCWGLGRMERKRWVIDIWWRGGRFRLGIEWMWGMQELRALTHSTICITSSTVCHRRC